MEVPMSDTGSMGAGFADPVQHSQAIFRCVLEAMARPGISREIPVMPYAPAPFNAASTAVALTLLDDSTPVWLDAAANSASVREFLAFHCGCPIVERPNEAVFAMVAGPIPSLDRFDNGSDEFPENATTVIVQVAALEPGNDICFAGPGIQDVAFMADPGMADSFWREWSAMGALYPRGVDLILTARHRLACMPRTVRRIEPGQGRAGAMAIERKSD
jgi:alpha-D-ribose 1-methylphosphonate 5-triphosphate synthase subunit PhnH